MITTSCSDGGLFKPGPRNLSCLRSLREEGVAKYNEGFRGRGVEVAEVTSLHIMLEM